jgi:hypothetical protein
MPITGAPYNDTEHIDLALDFIKDNVTQLCFCSALPTTYTEATSTYMLAIKSITDTDFTGPQVGYQGGQSRQIIVNGHTGILGTNTGLALFVALVDVTNTKIRYINNCWYPIESGVGFNFEEFFIEIGGVGG